MSYNSIHFRKYNLTTRLYLYRTHLKISKIKTLIGTQYTRIRVQRDLHACKFSYHSVFMY